MSTSSPLTTEPKRLRFPRLYPKQAAFVHDPARYTVFFASTKSGKSVGLLCWILGRAWEIGAPGRDFHWIAPAFSVAKVMDLRMQRWLRRADPRGEIWRANDTELYIELSNGSRIWFKGGDRPDLLYGPDSWGVVIDEGTRVREECFHAARSMVTKTGAPIKIIGNMKGRKNWMYTLYQRGLMGAPDISCHLLDAYDAVEGGVIALEEVEDAQRTLPASVFGELYLAKPSDDAGNPFGLDAIRRCVAPLSDAPPVAFGVDLAKSQDWTVATGLDAHGRVCVFERWQGPWEMTIARLKSLIGMVPALVDSTGVGDPVLEDLQSGGNGNFEGYKFTAPSKQQLMEGLAVAIQQRQIQFPDGIITSELESMEYEYTRSGVRYSVAEGLHDDCVMALALAREKSRGLCDYYTPLPDGFQLPGQQPAMFNPNPAVPQQDDEERRAELDMMRERSIADFMERLRHIRGPDPGEW